MFEQYKNLDEFYGVASAEDRELLDLKQSANKLEVKRLSCYISKKKFEDVTPVKVNIKLLCLCTRLISP